MKLVLAWIGALLVTAPLMAQSSARLGGERTEIERKAQDVIVRELERRARRDVAPEVLRAAAARATEQMTDRQVIDFNAHGDAAALVDRMLSAAAASRLQVATAAATLGNPFSDLLFVPLTPCRILDTRIISGGLLAPGQRRDFLVAGTNAFLAQGGNGGGCGVPDGTTEPVAAAAVINFIAVSPQGPGHIIAWEYGQTEPLASIINFAAVGLNIANGIVIPIDGTTSQPFDLSVRPGVSATHLVADVTGYFTRFPVELFAQPQKDRVSAGLQTAAVSLGDGTCHRLTTCDVTSPAGINGTVLIKSWAQVSIDHTTGTHDRVIVGAKQFAATVNCTPVEDQVANMDFEVSDVWPTEPAWEATISNGRTFAQNGGITRTYEVVSRMIIGASAGDAIESTRMVCLFIPN
jgi:hypothetical protein